MKSVIVLTVVWTVRTACLFMDQVYAVSDAELLKGLGCQERTFKVTAYYSPTADQSFYYKGNYTDEVILNGKGIAGASGKPVFNGMVAAPATYPFGAKIYFPGWGRGEVADRGGAIVHSGERNQPYDRIDMRVGKGEEGLMRGLGFGVKTFDGWYCPPEVDTLLYADGTKASLGFDWSKIPLLKHFFTVSLFMQEFGEGRKDVRVRELQKRLIELGYLYAGKDTSYFGPETKQALCSFQIDKKIVAADSAWCGWYGVQTRFVLKSTLQRLGKLPKNLWETTSKDAVVAYAKAGTWEQTLVREEDKNVLVANSASTPTVVEKEVAVLDLSVEEVQFTRSFYLGQKHKEVSLLQQRLSLLGYAIGETNGVYTQDMRNAVYAFQKTHNLMDKYGRSVYPGYLDVNTRDLLNKIDWKLLEDVEEKVKNSVALEG